MRFVTYRGSFPLLAALLFAGTVDAQMLGTTARQVEAGSWQALFFYQGTRSQDLSFAVSDAANCAGGATPPGSGVTFPCASTGELEADGSGEAFVLKLAFQPRERGIQLYGTAGVGEYAMTVGSQTVFNSRVLDRAGVLTSLGAKVMIWPDTVVTPALAVDGSVGWQRYFGADRLDLFQTQVALEASHLFRFERTSWELEPYGGVKWLGTRAQLKDVGSGSRVAGREDAVTPFVGFRMPLFTHDSLFGEVSFVKGVQFASGIALRFGGGRRGS